MAPLVVGTETVDEVSSTAAVFAGLRAALRVPGDLLKDNFDFAELRPSGGKGGQLLARSKCKRWFVKELSKVDDATLRDGDTLEPYASRVSGGHSLLCRIVAHFERRSGGPAFLVMNNWLPTGEGIVWDKLYDLKGTADDKILMDCGEDLPEVHKRCWDVRLMCGEATGCCEVPAERVRYKTGKTAALKTPFPVLEAQRSQVLREMDADVKLLSSLNLMDYSMIVGVQKCAPQDVAKVVRVPQAGDTHAHPLVCVHGGEAHVFYFGIIDFLQVWNGGKKCAHVIKLLFAPRPISTVPPDKYAAQFSQFFHKKLVSEGTSAARGLVGPLAAAALPVSSGATAADDDDDVFVDADLAEIELQEVDGKAPASGKGGMMAGVEPAAPPIHTP
eukprot:CAMPEP_0183797640 /NCGR_PEP_ID=MMETSP0803_2-20130417/16469_1 /TAXON_ID=195967 /ORGANISM="Crustomastix stigmata, Strain CCMP3273" /LENGTH=387 /DNA_ID=CAMNT_0026042313 /DNA_START=1 /DNA_END=1161 /DNA_ORIENTATION=+